MDALARSPSSAGAASAAGPQAERDVLEHGHVAEERVVLEDETDLRDRRRGRLVTSSSVKQDATAARIGLLQAGDDAQQRRLARAGRAEQRDQLAAGNVEADVVEREEGPNDLADVAGLRCSSRQPSLRPQALVGCAPLDHGLQRERDQGQQRQERRDREGGRRS